MAWRRKIDPKRVVVLATARPKQVAAAVAAARAQFAAAEIAVICAGGQEERYRGDVPVLPVAAGGFDRLAASPLSPGPSDIVVLTLNHYLGRENANLRRLLATLSGRKYLAVWDGRLLPLTARLRWRWRIADRWKHP